MRNWRGHHNQRRAGAVFIALTSKFFLKIPSLRMPFEPGGSLEESRFALFYISTSVKDKFMALPPTLTSKILFSFIAKDTRISDGLFIA